MFWACPHCHGSLADVTQSLRCESCGQTYPVIGGIPDLRIPERLTPWLLEDRARAAALAEHIDAEPIDVIIGRVFDRPAYWTQEMAAARVRRTLEGPTVLRREVRGWLDTTLARSSVFVDVGCGLGALLCAAALEGRQGAGVDRSLHLLVAARRLIMLHGGQPDLACAFAERLPLQDGVVDGIVMYDALEHFSEQAKAIGEAGRVLRPGGMLSVVIPNRFSLAAEPHVGVWGVGWLPRRFQRAYVRRRTAIPYEDVRLPSTWEAARWLRKAGLHAVMAPKRIPEEEIAYFSGRRARLARIYNILRGMPAIRNLLVRFGPSVEIRAGKPHLARPIRA